MRPVVGSSPLARGLQDGRDHALLQSGIIPARAGFTPSGPCLRSWTRDHPRSRGVYTVRTLSPLLDAGSSPLARGLRHDQLRGRNVTGIIPARAGFTVLRPPRLRGPSDHPRSRGVYPGRRPSPSATRGSSPLARGLLVGRNVPVQHDGIIPARAGFTRGRSDVRPDGGDHPRSRGVYPLSLHAHPADQGSSPLARGLRRHGRTARLRFRIIPARAGFTPQRPALTCLQGDHPRSRGVYA